MKVIHLSHTHDKSGAGIAAKRIHSSIFQNKKLNIKSSMRVNRLFDKNDQSIYGPSYINKIIVLIKMFLERKIINFLAYKDSNFHSLSILPNYLYKEINNYDIDLVHLHWVQHEMLSIESIGKIKKPIIWTFHDSWPYQKTAHYPIFKKKVNQINQKYKLQKLVDNWCLRRKKDSWNNYMAIVCPSTWMANNVKKSELMNKHHIEVIPNPLDTNIFKPFEANQARSILGINKKSKVILFGALDGSKDPRKGFDLFKKIIEKLPQDFNEIEVLIFGSKLAPSQFKNKIPIRNLGIIKDRRHLAKIYSASDLMVIPSRLESFGQTASEAHSCGTPVIAFDTSGLKDIVLNESTGFLIKKYDCEEMSRKIISLIENKKLIKKFSDNARKRALEKWSYEVVSHEYFKLYEKVYNLTIQ
ncbi:putative glycosyl transferase [Prochlorococcus marinus str. MIT 9321]|uniref:Putative glycosyl transferase n=1 Tax=Prochlorococcus marinus str. MIT 9401 TaxID=167551 RepID=A0A0A2BD75_PROMR|nr:glycosyltransferase [Prochlorococcus marinus]KGG02882.1 putative glycosyl transferase [Prochlorococcus marinus str. MIT 9321]KGG05505.1 putative glycosyl transferase [Prochlorococcus marinus str. MIT 9322]KGG10539.1 putative glycosyl transferase [Prochlorococcus marinus str. MIT 9401]